MSDLEAIVEELKKTALDVPEEGWLSDLSSERLEWDESNKTIVIGHWFGSIDVGHLSGIVERLIEAETNLSPDLQRTVMGSVPGVGSMGVSTTGTAPLNPDALEAGAKALFIRERKYHVPTPECPEPPNWEDLTDPSLEHYRDNARAVLAVAQPVVNSVEELDALPFNTVAMFTMLPLDRPVPFELSSINGTDRYWMQPGDGAGYTNVIMARYLPARVLYRPTEEPTNGR